MDAPGGTSRRIISGCYVLHNSIHFVDLNDPEYKEFDD